MRSYEFLLMVVWVESEYDLVIRTTPVLLSTTKYHASATPVLQRTTPVLFCTTKYYSSTNLCYKLQCYSVLQRTAPVLSILQKSTLQYFSARATPVLILYYRSTTSGSPESSERAGEGRASGSAPASNASARSSP